MLCPTLAPQTVEAWRRLAAGHGIDTHRRADVRRAGTRPRRHDEPDGGLRRRWYSNAGSRCCTTLSSRLFRIGSAPGDGARTKLVNNLLAAINLAGAAEALALAQRLGLEPAATLAVIEQSSGQSWIGSDRLRRALAADPAVHAQMALLAKDSGLAMSMAAAAGLQPQLGQVAAAVFAQACADGLADQTTRRCGAG